MKYLNVIMLLVVLGCGPATIVANVPTTTAPCTVSKKGTIATIACPDGSQVIITDGAPGANGLDGKDGINGVDGAKGVDATPTTVVQFCPGYKTQYPSTFPEDGLCISNTLYGVYWDGHNAWLSPLPPGNYLSTSTSAPCSFKVESNCKVSTL